jgi:predicted DNA-binding transcriptional regulator YafY
MDNTMVYIDYANAKGFSSTRTITILGVNTSIKDFVVTAHCHERNAMRTFKLSRIVDIVDINTGEIFENKREFLEEID